MPIMYLSPNPRSRAASIDFPSSPTLRTVVDTLPVRHQYPGSIWLTKSSPSPGRRPVETRATSCSSLLEEPRGQLLLFGTPVATRCRHASEIWSIGPTKAYQAIGEAGSVRSIWFVVERSRPTVEIRDEDCLVQKC